MNKEQVNNIYITLVTAQYLADHIEDKNISHHWAKNQLKFHLKGTVKEIIKMVDIPFKVSEANENVEQQHMDGAAFAEQNFRTMLKLQQLEPEDQFKFQMAFENLLSRFKLK